MLHPDTSHSACQRRHAKAGRLGQLGRPWRAVWRAEPYVVFRLYVSSRSVPWPSSGLFHCVRRALALSGWSQCGSLRSGFLMKSTLEQAVKQGELIALNCDLGPSVRIIHNFSRVLFPYAHHVHGCCPLSQCIRIAMSTFALTLDPPLP